MEQEGATADNFILRSRKIKIVRWATFRLNNGSVGSWSTFTQTNSCPSKTFIHGRRNSNVSTWIKLSARFKIFFKPGQIVYVDTSGKWRSKSSRSNHCHTVFVCARSGQLTFPHKKAISLSAGLHEIRCSNRQSSVVSNLGQGMRDQYKSSIHCCWQKAVNTSVFQKASITV